MEPGDAMSREYMTEGQFKRYCDLVSEKIMASVELILPRYMLPMVEDAINRHVQQRGTSTMPVDQDELNKRFDHHPPKDDDTIHRHEEIRRHGKMFAYAVTQLVPAGREQSMALTDIEDAVMHANAGIARNQ
jgi:hypothetical protein